METLEIKRGNPLTAIATLTYTATGEPMDLTDCVVLFTAKKMDDNALDDDDAVIKSELIPSEPANGIMIISLTAEDTAVPLKLYKCDIRAYKEGELQDNTNIFYIEVKGIVTERTS